ncbi:facilitated trehalose transporter Tret1-like isoform X2 [Belonocnema kinseyi]|uniref:facilitated trehalose transporter Tret1-like isoform X2 n=1 Tax=Belonocnema kinseyi TaxID=2817044 RepID=UPI00143D6F16|nr:facilitated trehalose transporter Tret1-like isoform X2 [Belonocnema kinseyi]XP_033208294.1 facilitated trehalose transporter Tret1-like isoform X2 [Belonocnema kinseyi]XP_033208295.1 facilitated trehalose transporter Tret1-like isoform X2 [Belonocnema kinseyi]
MAIGISEENQSVLNYKALNVNPKIKQKELRDSNENNNNYDQPIIIKQYSSNSKGVMAQCLVTAAVFILMVGCGMPIGYSAILLPQLLESNGTLHINSETGSWIASVHSLATPIGALVSGPLMDFIGRRGCLQLASIPLCSGWIVMGLSKYIQYVFVGRILSGFAVGLTAVPAQVILGEMSDPGLRGMLVGGTIAAYCAGILLVYFLGAILPWDIVAFYGTIPSILGLAALCLVHESPAWLMRQKKGVAARKALFWLRGGDKAQVSREAEILEARANSDLARKTVNSSISHQIISVFSKILNPSVMKPLIIINVFNVLQLLSGTYVIVFYGVDLIKHIGGSSVDNYFLAVLLAVMRFVFSLCACFLLLKVGRRTLGLLSGLGTGLSSLTLASYLLLRKGVSYYDIYIIGACLLIYVAANTVGFMCLPGIMVGELLPQRARGLGGGFIFFLFHVILFGVTKYYPMVTESVGIPGIFLIFGNFALMNVVFIYFSLPETKDRTLQEIEDYFQEENLFWMTRKEERKQAEPLI